MSASFEGKTGKQRATSFLVRFWEEPQERQSGRPVIRGYLRNLATGEERYIRDPAHLGEQILGHFRDAETPSQVGEGDAAELRIGSKD